MHWFGQSLEAEPRCEQYSIVVCYLQNSLICQPVRCRWDESSFAFGQLDYLLLLLYAIVYCSIHWLYHASESCEICKSIECKYVVWPHKFQWNSRPANHALAPKSPFNLGLARTILITKATVI